MSAPLPDSHTLKPGDVCLVAVQLRDRTTGQPYWWKRFTCVLEPMGRHCNMLTLKMHVDLDKDIRTVDFKATDVVTKVEEVDWPQGVIAMRTKWIAKGLIKLDDSPS